MSEIKCSGGITIPLAGAGTVITEEVPGGEQPAIRPGDD